MTPAEHLSAAATRLRELAGAATPGDWLPHPMVDAVAVENVDGQMVYFHPLVGGETSDQPDSDAALIATLAAPPVALALADWLEAEAEHVASYDCMAHCEPAGCDRGHKALALAALIVPEAEKVES